MQDERVDVDEGCDESDRRRRVGPGGPGQAGRRTSPLPRRLLVGPGRPAQVGPFIRLRGVGSERRRVPGFKREPVQGQERPSRAAGLYPKRGTRISWVWKVGTRTTPDRWPIIVFCGSAGSLRTWFVVV
jgi:hypothetical protein